MAVVLVLMMAGLLTALGSALIVLSNTEGRIAAAQHGGTVARYVAESAVERAVVNLASSADWSSILRGVERSDWHGGDPNVRTSWNLDLDLDAIGSGLPPGNCGLNGQTWRLYGFGAFDTLTGGRERLLEGFAAVWVADDCNEVDGDPAADSNATLVVRALGTTTTNLTRWMEATVQRSATGVRLLAWDDVRAAD